MLHPSNPSRERLDSLRANFPGDGVDAVLVPRYDAHLGEYCAPHDERLRFLTGFTGSAGMCLILADRAVMFVDGRYQVQVRQQVDLDQFEIAHLIEQPVARWLVESGATGLRVGVNPMLIPGELHAELSRVLTGGGGALVALDADSVDRIWPDQPPPPLAPISAMPAERSGETSADKRRRIGARLHDLQADLLVEAQPDNIAWLLNVRGVDVDTTTAPHSFALVDGDGGVEWFVDERKLPNDRDSLELDGVTLRSPGALVERITARASNRAVVVDPQHAPAALALAVEIGGGRVVREMSPITLMKASKNAVELQGFRDCHIEDGVALSNFMAWLQATVPARAASGNPVTELEAEEKVLAFRQASSQFLQPSFRAISASDANAAMCHYVSTPQTNAPITASSVYLLDSGGHYLGGTTDVTRTMCLAPPDAQFRSAYTAVLKGLLATLMLRFPAGTFGHQIDAFARKPLWDLGLDFDHGTGHGVGHVGAIHEAPHRITRVANPFEMSPGKVLTVEPGCYVEGQFGIRIENQVEVVDVANGFLQLRSLTLCPILLEMAELSELTAAERAFLDEYHARVRAELMPRVLPETRDWLASATAPIAV
ncbi:M24 family metallopeptidase [Devosia sp.]|uniref:M24 family metallopeptidase n=1 Tax=Devosia sp. TaxID=1871048 RepID=UPI003A935E22